MPLNAEFVGFRASRQAEQAIAELRISPRSVVETRKRIPAGTVLSAAVFAPVRIFSHDSLAYPSRGFWVRADNGADDNAEGEGERSRRPARCSQRRASNVVTFATPGWSQKLELVPGVTARVTVPSKAGERTIALTISTTDGFVPAEIERSRDRRLLGAWIALFPDDIARSPQPPEPVLRADLFPSSRLRGKY